MQKKILHTSIAVTLTVLALLFVSLTVGLYRVECGQLAESLDEEARVIQSALAGAADESEALAAIASSRRLTLIGADGTVLYDSAADVSGMENHAGREEFRLAVQNGNAYVTRRSGTLSQQMAYRATRLPSGNVLRLAAMQRSVWGHMTTYLPWMLLALAVCLALAAVLSRVGTKRLVAPIVAINPEKPLDNDCYEELTPLLRRLSQQQEQNEAQLDTLREQKQKQDALLSHMREGLVILNRNERVLTLNDAASAILEVKGRDVTGRTLLEINRSATLQDLMERGRAQQNADCAWRHGARHYHVSLSRIGTDEGMLLLFRDDTAENDAEEMRRQFTANVSHELRTPLTAISGYAELMETGMVKPEDEHGFAVRIRRESERMLTLVEDILRLSQLDEGSVKISEQEIDLRAAAEDVMKSLADKAEKRDITLALTGDSAKVTTDPTLLSEIMYNLVDNAIKYNRAGGSVTIDVSRAGEGASFCVRDTGVGIPPREQSKVFERFYRVDKSRSKETGGTGLGLSIVKHAAKLMRAEVHLQSELGVGTSVSVALRPR